MLGIAARVFGIDVAPLAEEMRNLTNFMGSEILEQFNHCASGVRAAALKVADGVRDGLSAENVGAAVKLIEEFRDSPDPATVSQITFPEALQGEALKELLKAVPELEEAMQTSRQVINGLHCYTVKRPTTVLPDKVMWVCEHHRDLLQRWDDKTLDEEQLLEAAAVISAAKAT